MKSANVVIASHIYATGPALELEEYLKDKVNTLGFIGHPFDYTKKHRSFYRNYKNGRKINQGQSPDLPILSPLYYLRDIIFTIYWTLRRQGKIDIFIGSDNFLAFLGLLLKRIGKVDKVILYTIDYVPNRFSSSVMNYLYHFFDKQCLENCEIIWNVSPRIERARKKKWGKESKRFVKQIVVPLGMWYDRIPKVPFSKKNRYRVIFMGHLLEKQGLQIVIEAMPAILKKLPKAELIVIGAGPYEEKLKQLVANKKLEKHVKFLGYIKDHKNVEKELAKSMLAVATYKPSKDSFTYFADPGKIKNYLGAGLPIVLTDVPQIGKVIEKKKSGYLTKYNKFSVANKILLILANENKLREFSKNTRSMAREFDWNIVFRNALKETVVI